MKKFIKFFLVLFITFIYLPGTLFGQAGNAINFQNLDYMKHGDFVYCGSPNYGFADKLTVSAWVKWTTDASSFAVTPTNHENEGYYSTYISFGSHNSNDITSDNIQFSLRNAKTGNKFEFVVQTSNGRVIATSSSGPSSVGTWYFLTGVYDGSNIYIYVNGNLTKTVAQTGTINTNAAHRLNMGKLPWGYGFFVGYLDEVRIWARALDVTEIVQQMNSKATINSTDLKSYWNFDTSSGITIDDSGPTNADGIFYSAAIDVHSGGSDFANKIIGDSDKDWSLNNWSGQDLKTVSGAGIDETNSIVSNTVNTITVAYGFGGEAPNNKTTPVYDSKTNADDTWFGVEISGETSQWVTSDISTLPVELTSFSAITMGKSVTLRWETATEVNNYGFNIEFRMENGEWKTIGFVNGNGNSNSPKNYSFTDNSPIGGKSFYRLKQIDFDGSFEYCNPVEVITAIASFELHQNFPNPFNPITTISYSLRESANVKLTVFDPLGREVANLVNSKQESGVHNVTFDGTYLNSGVYFYRLNADRYSEVRKLLLLK